MGVFYYCDINNVNIAARLKLGKENDLWYNERTEKTI